ncbi:peptidyl-tRNA hydrolase, PTH1 family [Salinibacillus kushneri]|uniref:Peptidyl-tRNA hydrolase n=1 Tax=Salinibacillus kushneri TaxID=237682 RepID=A0A1I0J9L9_9BACI|nr:aminoacyl-tRNA hydrolase [Salinibacillus kushneri]SEU06562.1 peptidyl-tRNA hydrolase, PTH1 family [Salinibacillus kushneri]
MKCIVGLGNPGSKFALTRHNIGFQAIDYLAEKNNWTLNKEKFNALYTIEYINGEKVILLKPQTYMNLSGEAVQPFMNYYDLDIEDLLVIYDDLDLPAGKIRLRQKGGHGGHNGIRNIINQTALKNFKRIRLGIGRPETNMPVVDYVLGKFTEEQKPKIEDSVQKAAEACEMWLEKPFLEVMNYFNA